MVPLLPLCLCWTSGRMWTGNSLGVVCACGGGGREREKREKGKRGGRGKWGRRGSEEEEGRGGSMHNNHLHKFGLSCIAGLISRSCPSASYQLGGEEEPLDA